MNWYKKVAAGLTVALVSSVAAMGCTSGSATYEDPRRIVDPEEVPETKRIRRLTADQFFASLRIATGQQWDSEDQFAATLGRPDFGEVTVEGREMSVGFAKLVGDAARQTCRRAVEQDRDNADAASRVILRGVASTDPLDPFDATVGDNLRYLLLRFHGVHVIDDADRRMQPWFTVLRDGLDPTDDARFAEAGDRWMAVCTGLVLHPDFLTY